MDVRIMGRERLEMISYFPFPQGTSLISITDTDSAPVRLENRPARLLRLSFDDICEDSFEGHPCEKKKQLQKAYPMMTKAQAAKIAAFFMEIRSCTDTLICQCEFGQSRSAAVAAAILEYSEKRGLEIFADDRYSPNKHVFRMVLDSLRAETP